MSDSQTLKKLSSQFGTEVVGIQTTFALSAAKSAQVKGQYLKLIQERNIPEAQLVSFENIDKKYSVLTKPIDDGSWAASAVRIEPYGNDLWVEVRHYEVSAKANSNKSLWGVLLLVGGLLFIWTGIGFFVFIAGIAILSSKPHFPDSSAERDASKLLFETVVETLTIALVNCDVDAEAQIQSDF
jgi:hypothetical protein